MFVIHQGMSGTGKTTALMDMITRQNQEVIYLVPDQMSVHTERYVTSRVKNKATTQVYVYTFKLLEKQILKQSENHVYTELGLIEQFFLLLQILDTKKDQIKTLRYMRQNSDQMKECLELFTLWRTQCIDPEMVSNIEVDGKMRDLLFLYREFMDKQQDGMYFPEEIYRLASSSLEQLPFFENKIVVIDGFYLFSETEKVMIHHILKQADEVHLTLPQYINGNMPKHIAQTKDEMIEIADKFNQSVQVQVYDQLVRQQPMTGLYSLVENLPNTNAALQHKGDQTLQFIQAQTIDEEVHEIASSIRSAVMNGDVTYSDCALYVSDSATYRDKIQNIFPLYHIPVFLDAKEHIQYTQLAQLLHLLTELLTAKMTGSRIIALLKTGLFMPMEEVYILEPILRMFTLQDDRAFSSEKWELYLSQFSDDDPRIHAFERLQTVVDALVQSKKEFGKQRQFGLKLTCLFACMDDFEIFEQLSTTMDQTILQMFADRVDDLFTLFKETRVTNTMFTVIIKMIVEQLTYMKQPSSQNQVIIADFTRSRISQNMQLSGSLGVKHVYIPGFIQGSIPPYTPAFTLIHQDELVDETLKQFIPSDQKEYELRFMYIYFAFAQASQRLTLSYSKRTRDNAETTVHRMFELLKQQSENDIISAKSIRQPYVPTNTLFQTEALLFSPFLVDHQPFHHVKDEMENLTLDKEEQVYSVSQFERYNQCPFQYFLERKIGLFDQVKTFTDARTIGNITHDFMEDIAKDPIDVIEHGDPLQRAETFLTKYENEVLGFSFAKESAYTQLLREKICQHLSDNMQRYVYFRHHAQFVPFATEAVFEIQMHDKRVRGKIDRVDIADYEGRTYFQVIDYKSSVRTFDWSSFQAGVQLQLPFYVYAKGGMKPSLPSNVQPYGFYYQTLKVDDDKYRSESIHLDGYTVDARDLIQSLNDDVSMYTGMSIKKDGTLGSRAKTLTESQFAILNERTEQIAQETIERIENQQFHVQPLAFVEKGRVHEPNACTYCRFQGICQRELLTKADFRKVEKIDKEDIV